MGCGTAVLATTNGLSVGTLGVSFAFGLTVLTGAYALGHISGGHFNPAVTLGLVAGKRFPAADAPAYVAAQVIGGLLGADRALRHRIGHRHLRRRADGFAANGYDDLSPGGYNLAACFVAEVVLTAVFLLVIMGATRVGSPAGTAPVAIGLALTLIHLISIPVTNTSVNPARSTSQAVFAGGDYLPQLWLFWLAPVVGGVLGALDLPRAPRRPGGGHRRPRERRPGPSRQLSAGRAAQGRRPSRGLACAAMGSAGKADPAAAADAIVDEAMRGLVARTGEDELTVGAALPATAALREAADRKLFELVGFAREAGASWSSIGEALGVTTQAAHQRYGPKLTPKSRRSAS